MNLNAYLTFQGTCENALNFYKTILNGEISSLSYFDSAPMPVPEDLKKKILHAEFKFGNNIMMASDAMPGQPVIAGNNITLSLSTTDIQETERIFNAFAEGGQITMPLQDTFWGAKFGMVTDKFGINWMFNCQLSQ